MAIVRWDPYREMATMQDRFNRLFGDLSGQRDESIMSRGAWLPAVDIYETDNHELVLEAELPDMKREDIKLTVENNTLTITGERKLQRKIKEEQFHRVERSYGTFSRAFALPPTVDATRVTAEYRDGVLTVTLPLREDAKPRHIPVNAVA
jgi:HSP20 family protein